VEDVVLDAGVRDGAVDDGVVAVRVDEGAGAAAPDGRSLTGTPPPAVGTSSWYWLAPELPGGDTCVSAWAGLP
jgi:hypothetical protein